MSAKTNPLDDIQFAAQEFADIAEGNRDRARLTDLSVSDVRACIDLAEAYERDSARMLAARAAVAELVEAAKLVNADHSAPHDCYATGPLTGDPYLDLVRCPGCQLAAALADFEVTP